MNQPMIVPPGGGLRISAEGVQPTAELRDNYSFLMNVSQLIEAPRITLAPGHELRRATHDENTTIREILEKLGNTLRPHSAWQERRLRDGRMEVLPEEEWRYYVIGFRESNNTLVGLEEACSLAPVELDIGFTVLTHMDGHPANGLMWHPGRLFQVINRATWSDFGFVEVTATDIETISAIHTRLQQHDARLVDVTRLVRQLQDLKALPQSAPLLFLGYFAVLESLLTHPPMPSDPYDSITRQVKKKVHY